MIIIIISRKKSKSLPRIPPDCPILFKWVFDNFILADKPFAKHLQNFVTCAFVNNNLCAELFSLLESSTIFEEIFKATSVLFFIPDFNFLSYELDNFMFKVLY